MAKRIRLKTVVKIYRETAEKNADHVPDDKLAEEIVDGYERASYRDIHIAALGTEVQTFPDVTAVRGVEFIADSDFDADINGLGVLQFRRLNNEAANTTEKLRLFLQANITSLSLISPAGSTIALTGVLVYWGDPTP